MEKRPWTNRQLKDLSDHIRSDSEPNSSLPDYDEVMLFFNDLAAEVQDTLRTYDWSALLDRSDFRITSRPKTIDTLRQKLIRQPTYSIATIQDIAGVRFEARMTLEQQTVVAQAIAAAFGHDRDCIQDLRDDAHSGYRAVHVRLSFPGVGKVEVQVRTFLQGQWANAYERAADAYGRDIRYGNLPEDAEDREIVEAMHLMSVTAIRDYEAGTLKLAQVTDEVAVTLKGLRFANTNRAKRQARALEAELRAVQDQTDDLHSQIVVQLRQMEAAFTRIQSQREAD